jgi:hypothetical protein
MYFIQANPAKEYNSGLLGDDAEELDKQMTDDKIDKIGPPFRVKFCLILVFGKEQFNGNKNKSHEQYVEQHPIESEIPG